jgi:hypothetical protein
VPGCDSKLRPPLTSSNTDPNARPSWIGRYTSALYVTETNEIMTSRVDIEKSEAIV